MEEQGWGRRGLKVNKDEQGEGGGGGYLYVQSVKKLPNVSISKYSF